MFRYWLMNVHGIGTRRLPIIIEEIGSAEALYFANENSLKDITEITEEEIIAIQNSKLHWNLDKEWIKFQEKGIDLITMEEEGYPDKLRTIIDPPYGLFYKGLLPNEQKKSVAIIGARQRSAYGEAMAQELGKTLAEYDVQVISGLARGIDADAHKGALKGDGITFGVLGCGVDVIYPQGNKFLYDQILDGQGGIISEFPLGTQALKMNFPRRNRIISGLSDYVVIMEAKNKSGSLITADFALEQGREVYALPGRVTDPLSEGCNKLIREGSGVYLGVDDFLKDIGLLNKNNKKNLKGNKKILEKEERLLYSLIDFTPIGIGYLLQKSSLSFRDLIRIIENLKAKGMIYEQPSNYFIRVKN